MISENRQQQLWNRGKDIMNLLGAAKTQSTLMNED